MTNEGRNDERNAEHTQVTEEYTQVNANFRMLADIRFKLLALIPTLGGVAIFLLSRMEPGKSQPQSGYSLLFLISLLGFVATLRVTFYDQRNSELYNALIGRAKYLEKELKLPRNPRVKRKCSSPYRGQFEERPTRGRHLFGFIVLGHDSGLALIYGAVLGAWFYPLASTFLGWTARFPESRHTISLVIAAFMAAIFMLELLRLDGTFETKKNKVNVQEEIAPLRFRGKELACYKEDNSYFTLYKCPRGYRVYIENGGNNTASLEPSSRNSNGDLEYPTYTTKLELVDAFPKFGDALDMSVVRDLD